MRKQRKRAMKKAYHKRLKWLLKTKDKIDLSEIIDLPKGAYILRRTKS